MSRWTLKDSLFVGTLAGIVLMMAFIVYQSVMTRKMLNARAVIQTTLVDSACRKQIVDRADCDRMYALWSQAGYPKGR